MKVNEMINSFINYKTAQIVRWTTVFCTTKKHYLPSAVRRFLVSDVLKWGRTRASRWVRCRRRARGMQSAERHAPVDPSVLPPVTGLGTERPGAEPIQFCVPRTSPEVQMIRMRV